MQSPNLMKVWSLQSRSLFALAVLVTRSLGRLVALQQWLGFLLCRRSGALWLELEESKLHTGYLFRCNACKPTRGTHLWVGRVLLLQFRQPFFVASRTRSMEFVRALLLWNEQLLAHRGASKLNADFTTIT